ncbi:MAG: hypothetical protein ACE366_19820 [Bradymonadia bacterium]
MIFSVPFDAHDTLVFADAFAVTRIQAAKKLKSIKDVSCARSGYLLPLNEHVLISGVDLNAHSRLCTVPDLKSETIRDIRTATYGFSQDACTAYRFDLAVRSEVAPGESDHCLFVYAFRKEELTQSSVVRRNRLQVGEQQVLPNALPTFELGGSERAFEPDFQHVWPDGRFLINRKGWLSGRLHNDSFDLDWHLPMTHGLDPLRTEARVEGDDLWIMGEAVGGGEALLARVDPRGEVSVWRFEALEAPAYHQGQVALLVAPDTVERFPLSEPTARERFTFDVTALELEGGLEPAEIRVGQKLTPTAAPDHRGRVMLQGDYIYYLPWHGEVIVHVNAPTAKKQLIPRKLPPKTHDLRTFYSRWVSQLRAAAYEAGVSLQPRRCWHKRSSGVQADLSIHVGRQDFTAFCFSGVFREARAHCALAETFGLPYVHRYPSMSLTLSEPVTVETARAGLDYLARHGCSAVDLLYPFEMFLKKHTIDEAAVPAARPILAEAILAGCIGEAPSATPVSTMEEVERRLEAATDPYIPNSFEHGDDSIRWLLSVLLG